MISVALIRSLEQIRGLREGWDALAADSRSPLLEYDWFLSCAETFHREADVRVAVAHRSGVLEGVAPLAFESTPCGPRLTLLGASRLHEPGGWVFTSELALRALCEDVMKLGYPLMLQRVAAESPLCRVLPDLMRRRAMSVVRATAPSLGVATSGSWEQYYEGLSSRITSNLPRVRRKAERALGRVHITESIPNASEVDALLETLVAVEGSGWKGRRGSSLAQRTDLLSFFRRYCRRAAERKRLRFKSLSFGAETAAVELSVEAYNRVWQLKIGYREALAPYYPGLLLTEASIHSAFDRKLESYEFLGGAEPWEQRWRPDERNYRLVVVYPLNPGGIIGACRDFAGVAWRRVRAHRSVRPQVAEAGA